MKGLEKYREEINEIDRQIIDLFLARMELSKQIGEHKKAAGLPIFHKEREDEILEKIKARGRTKEEGELLAELFHCIFHCSKEVQK